MISNPMIYIHIPFCKSRCGYCDFFSTNDISNQGQYLALLKSELSAAPKRADSIYVGGGTPSALMPGAVSEILGMLPAAAEVTVEVNPDTFADSKLEEYILAGVSRISLGVQSLNDGALKAVKRRHTAAQALAVMRKIKGTADLSADIILGLPGDTLNTLENTIEQILEIRPEHVSAYLLSNLK